MTDYFEIHKYIQKKRDECINGKPLYEKDIDRIAEAVADKLLFKIEAQVFDADALIKLLNSLGLK